MLGLFGVFVCEDLCEAMVDAINGTLVHSLGDPSVAH